MLYTLRLGAASANVASMGICNCRRAGDGPMRTARAVPLPTHNGPSVPAVQASRGEVRRWAYTCAPPDCLLLRMLPNQRSPA